jgi:hypothetical protein
MSEITAMRPLNLKEKNRRVPFPVVSGPDS